MQQLNVYKENNEFILERINQCNTLCKQTFPTENGLLEAIEEYKNVIDAYKLDVEEGINMLPKIYNRLFAAYHPGEEK